MGQDGHDRGAKVIATAFADSDSTSTSGRCSRRRAKRPAWRSKTTCTSWAFRASLAVTRRSCPELIAELQRLGRGDILVFVGGVIPPRDYDMLRHGGRRGHFRPGQRDPVCAQEILDRLMGAARA